MSNVFDNPYWQTKDEYTTCLWHGDVLDVLKGLPSRSVHCVVTSPPYWGLRDYGTSQWEGGNPKCDHKRPSQVGQLHFDSRGRLGRNNTNWDHRHEEGYKETCKKCGAKRIDQQIGSESSPDCGTQGKAQCGKCFICTMVAVFREVRRVLRDTGTLWLNLGDTYASTGVCGGSSPVGNRKYITTDKTRQETMQRSRQDYGSLEQGNLVGVPWRVALALQANGWILRQDIIWHKPNPMPESVTNRCTKSHEYIFLLTKQEKYYYDAEAIKENTQPDSKMRKGFRGGDGTRYVNNRSFDNDAQATTGGGSVQGPNNRNKRSVWTIPSQPFPGAHFATFPKKLILPCILAGTSEKGCCAECGKPYKRKVEKYGGVQQKGESQYERDRSFRHSRNGVDSTLDSGIYQTRTLGWIKVCSCDTDEIDPCIVLDPFMGSGTTAMVALEHGRAVWGIDLSKEYLEKFAIPRVTAKLRSSQETSILVP